MDAARITTSRLTHIVCGMAAILATRLSAQGMPATTMWQATTTGMWSSDRGCSTWPALARRTLASSGTLSGRAGLAGYRRAFLDVSGGVTVGEPLCRRDRWSGLAALRATFEAPALRFWVAYTASNAGAIDTAVRQTGLSAGVQRRLGRALLSMSVGPRRDRTSIRRVIESTERLVPEKLFVLPGTTAVQETTFVVDTAARSGTRRVPDLGLAVSWTYRAIGIDAAAHLAAVGELQRTDPLARLQLTYDLAPRVSAIVGVVSRSALPSLDIPARQFASLGLRIRSRAARPAPSGPSRASASEFRAVSDSAGHVSLAVRADGAQRVEVAGDFTHWASIDLHRAPDGWWRARVRAAPGVHQLSVRVDAGRWSAPPGLPPVHDEFGATVGLLVVR